MVRSPIISYFNAEPLRSLFSLYRWIDFDVFSGASLGCLDARLSSYLNKALLASLLPLVLILVILMVWPIRLAQIPENQSHRRSDVSSVHGTAALALSYVVLPSVSSIQFRSFSCTSLDDLDIRFLKVDTSVDCAGHDFRRHMMRILPLATL